MDKTNTEMFKEVMGSYPTGVTIVTSADAAGVPVGLTVNSFASVSLEPMMVLWCIDHKVSSFPVFRQSEGFAVHILAADQKELCWTFAGKSGDRFAGTGWTMSAGRRPILPGCFAVMECRKVQEVEAGDHTILIGEVEKIAREDREPMLYFRRNAGAVPAQFFTE